MKNSLIKNTGNRGQALVEFALVLPLLLLLVFGIVEFGRYLFLKNTATNGARQGARQAAVSPLNSSNNWDADKRSAIFHAATSIYHGSKPWTVVITPDPPPNTFKSGDPVAVKVSIEFDSALPIGYLPFQKDANNKIVINAEAVMRFE